MAFENVFGNIDFQANNKMKSQQNAQLNAMLGQAIAAEQQEQDRELKRRQMEMKANEFKLGKAAENAAMKLELGMELTPQERAALSVKAKTSAPSVYTDQFGNQVVRPSGWSQYGASGAPQVRPERVGTPFNPDPAQAPNFDRQVDAMAGQVAPNPGAARLSVDMLQGMAGEIPPMDAMELEGGSPVPYQGQRDVVSDDGALDQVLMNATQANPMQELEQRAGSRYMQSPVGAIDAGKALTGVQEFIGKESAKANLEEIKAQKEKLRGMPKQERRIIESAFDWKGTNEILNEAIDMVTPFSAGLGTYTSVIPATPAKNLEAKLNTVKADSAFGALQKMRDNSKTGGALGQVSERELALLESAQAPLDQAQSPSALIDSLNDYKRKRIESLGRVADAFEQDYGRRSPQLDEMIQGMMGTQENKGWSIRKK